MLTSNPYLSCVACFRDHLLCGVYGHDGQRLNPKDPDTLCPWHLLDKWADTLHELRCGTVHSFNWFHIVHFVLGRLLPKRKLWNFVRYCMPRVLGQRVLVGKWSGILHKMLYWKVFLSSCGCVLPCSHVRAHPYACKDPDTLCPWHLLDKWADTLHELRCGTVHSFNWFHIVHHVFGRLLPRRGLWNFVRYCMPHVLGQQILGKRCFILHEVRFWKVFLSSCGCVLPCSHVRAHPYACASSYLEAQPRPGASSYIEAQPRPGASSYLQANRGSNSIPGMRLCLRRSRSGRHCHEGCR
jgi:hypothetical protein